MTVTSRLALAPAKMLCIVSMLVKAEVDGADEFNKGELPDRLDPDVLELNGF